MGHVDRGNDASPAAIEPFGHAVRFVSIDLTKHRFPLLRAAAAGHAVERGGLGAGVGPAGGRPAGPAPPDTPTVDRAVSRRLQWGYLLEQAH